MRHLYLHIILLMLCLTIYRPSTHAQYYTLAESPLPAGFMDIPEWNSPASNDTDTNRVCHSWDSPYWASDLYRYYQAREYRDSALLNDFKLACYWDYRPSSQATLRVYYINYLLKFFEPIFHLTTNQTTNRDICYFLDTCRMSVYNTLTTLPATWKRNRPCFYLRNDNFAMRTANYYTLDYTFSPRESFPSNEGTNGWLTGIVMGAINPWNADSLVMRGFQHGWYRTVCGSMWHSDVEVSRWIGTACYARMLANQRFRRRVEAMRQRVSTLLGFNNDSILTLDELTASDAILLQAGSGLLDPPSLSSSCIQSDLAYHLEKRELIDSLPPDLLLAESYRDPEMAITFLQSLLGVSIDPETSPCIYQFVTSVLACNHRMVALSKSRYEARKRPFEVFGTEPITFEPIDRVTKHSSYPSLHASDGWIVALLLSMIAPQAQNELLKAGYDYGMHRTITGMSWKSDIDAGRTIACLTLALATSTGDFMEMLDAAQGEYDMLTDRIITKDPTILTDTSRQDDDLLFTPDGRRATEASRGVIVGKNTKILRP